MKAKGFIELLEPVEGNLADGSADSFDRNRTDLLSLRLRVHLETGFNPGQQHLEWVHVVGIRRNRDHGDHAATQS